MKRASLSKRVLLALLAGSILGLCVPATRFDRQSAAQAEAPVPFPVSGQNPADDAAVQERAKEFLDLLYMGEMLTQCWLPDYATPMFVKAYNESVNFPLTDVRLRIEAQYALYLLKKRVNRIIGKTPAQIAATHLNRLPTSESTVLNSTREGIKRTDSADVRCLGRIASIYGYVVAGQWTAAVSEIDLAGRDAQMSSLRRTGDCFLAKAHVEAIQGQYSEADRSAGKALEYYTQAGEVLAQAETLLFKVTLAALTPSRSPRPAGQGTALLPDNLAEAPLLDPGRIASRGPELMAGYVVSARRHEYKKGMNQVITLLLLKRYAPTHPELQEALRTLRVNEAEMLAYLAYFVQLQGYAAPARLILGYSETAGADEIQPLAKARYDWIAGKYWRVSGDFMTAMRRFDHADKLLEKVAPSPDLAVGLPEERGLTLLQMGQPGPAKRVLEEALTRARSLQQGEDVERLERYIEQIDKGGTDVAEITTPPVDAEQRRKHEAWAALAFSGPPVFQPPFVSDYPPDKKMKSEAQAVAAVSGKLKRPTPSPKPYMESEGRIDILIRTRQWAKATPLLEQKVALLEQKAASGGETPGETIDTLMLLGQCYFNRLKWEQAAATFEKILKLEPNHSGAQGYLDLARERLKK